MKKRFYVSPEDNDDNVRTWDVRERMPDGTTRTVTQQIKTRIAAREEAKCLNEGRDYPSVTTPRLDFVNNRGE